MIPKEFISSFAFDKKLALYDIQGSIAHVRMLAKCKIIRSQEAKKIIFALQKIAKDLTSGKRIAPAEDIHFAIENELFRRIGTVAKKMHTARSRNDQVVLDMKLYVREISQQLKDAIRNLQKSILNSALKNQNVLMPGFTHLQHAQPIFFSHHLLAYAWMLERDKSRLRDLLKRMDENPLGACALAGTSFPIDRIHTAKLLGFSRVTENSIDTVSDRDFIAEFLFDCANLLVHLSRLAEELIMWCSEEFGFVELEEKFTSGSSIMPQKRNPDTLEIVRGKSSKTIANLMQILTLTKALPLAYNRDLQEDKPPLFDSAETALNSLRLMQGIIATLKVNRKKMEESCKQGFLLATELADYLTKKGLPFREAHKIVKQMVSDLRQEAKSPYGRSPEGRRSRALGKKPEFFQNLNSVALSFFKSYSPIFGTDLYRFLSPSGSAESKNSYGGTGKKALSLQIRKLQSLLK